MHHDTDSTPSIQDSFGSNGGTALPDEQFIDADAFADDQPTDDELEAMYADWRERLDREEQEARAAALCDPNLSPFVRGLAMLDKQISTSARIAQGNVAIIDAVTNALGRAS